MQIQGLFKTTSQIQGLLNTVQTLMEEGQNVEKDTTPHRVSVPALKLEMGISSHR